MITSKHAAAFRILTWILLKDCWENSKVRSRSIFLNFFENTQIRRCGLIDVENLTVSIDFEKLVKNLVIIFFFFLLVDVHPALMFLSRPKKKGSRLRELTK